MHISLNDKHLKPSNYLVTQNIVGKKKKNEENAPSLEVAKLVLVQFSRQSNQQKCEYYILLDLMNLMVIY